MIDYKSDCCIEEFCTLFILMFFLGIQIPVFLYIYIILCLVIVNLFIDSCQLVTYTRQLTHTNFLFFRFCLWLVYCNMKLIVWYLW
jgi:hypothetical protein